MITKTAYCLGCMRMVLLHHIAINAWRCRNCGHVVVEE